MGYILKTFDGKYWNKRHGSSHLGWVDDLQDATVYKNLPTAVVNCRTVKCYILAVKIVVVADPEAEQRTLKDLMGLRDEFWKKHLK